MAVAGDGANGHAECVCIKLHVRHVGMVLLVLVRTQYSVGRYSTNDKYRHILTNK